VNKHKEFMPFVKYAPMSRVPTNFPDFKNMAQALTFYACYSGVCAEYGQKLYSIVKDMTRDEIEKSTFITAKKKSVLTKTVSLGTNELKTRQDVLSLKIPGIGMGAKRFILTIYFNDLDCADTTDRHFLKGLAKVLKLDKIPTPSQAEKITSSWSPYGSVGSAMCRQVYSYCM
jgi:hypothetical protein